MRTIFKYVSYLGLLATVLPSILVFSDAIELRTHKAFMLAGLILWFATAPFWMGRKEG